MSPVLTYSFQSPPFRTAVGPAGNRPNRALLTLAHNPPTVSILTDPLVPQSHSLAVVGNLAFELTQSCFGPLVGRAPAPLKNH